MPCGLLAIEGCNDDLFTLATIAVVFVIIFVLAVVNRQR